MVVMSIFYIYTRWPWHTFRGFCCLKDRLNLYTVITGWWMMQVIGLLPWQHFQLDKSTDFPQENDKWSTTISTHFPRQNATQQNNTRWKYCSFSVWVWEENSSLHLDVFLTDSYKDLFIASKWKIGLEAFFPSIILRHLSFHRGICLLAAMVMEV